nr:hypothetical protein [Glycomyces sambucus]
MFAEVARTVPSAIVVRGEIQALGDLLGCGHALDRGAVDAGGLALLLDFGAERRESGLVPQAVGVPLGTEPQEPLLLADSRACAVAALDESFRLQDLDRLRGGVAGHAVLDG